MKATHSHSDGKLRIWWGTKGVKKKQVRRPQRLRKDADLWGTKLHLGLQLSLQKNTFFLKKDNTTVCWLTSNLVKPLHPVLRLRSQRRLPVHLGGDLRLWAPAGLFLEVASLSEHCFFPCLSLPGVAPGMADTALAWFLCKCFLPSQVSSSRSMILSSYRRKGSWDVPRLLVETTIPQR